MASSLFHILNISRQDMLSRLLDLDLTSNNLANVNTTGFKSNRTNFQELFEQANSNGVHISSSQLNTEQGSLRATGRTLDWAVQGEGFFQVQLEGKETGYTREGVFNLDADRNLVDSRGNPLIWDGEIPADASDVAIRPDGAVMAHQGTAWKKVGTVELARFINPTGLEESGSNLLLETESSGKPETGTPGTENFGWIRGQYLEQSNVNLSEEMTQLITLQRAFQMSVRTFQQTDTMINEAIHMRKA
jgi:flagellar basal-body rod protein FlgG